jgi:hypothetical protein
MEFRKLSLQLYIAAGILALASPMIRNANLYLSLALEQLAQPFTSFAILLNLLVAVSLPIFGLIVPLNGFRGMKKWPLKKLAIAFLLLAALKAFILILWFILDGAFSLSTLALALTSTSGDSSIDWIVTLVFWAATFFAINSTQVTEIDNRTKEEVRADKAKAKAEKFQAQLKLAAEVDEKYGHIMESGRIGFSTITIRTKGYVQIGSGYQSKLLGISSNLNSKKKNMVGRGLGAAVSGGANLLFTSGNKGLAYLTVVSEHGTQTFKSESPSDGELNAIMGLEAAGLAVIDMNHPSTPSQSQVASKDLDESQLDKQLAKLAKMHKAGDLSAEEYKAAKNKLLS